MKTTLNYVTINKDIAKNQSNLEIKNCSDHYQSYKKKAIKDHDEAFHNLIWISKLSMST